MKEHEYLEKMQKIQQSFLHFIEEETLSEEELLKFNIFADITKEEKIVILKETLLIISQISRYHYRTTFFHSKIEQIIAFYKDLIKENLSNKEIFNIFKYNKRILLFLFKEKIITIDNSICNFLSKYDDYFTNEINLFKGNKFTKDEEIERNRLIGENDNLICQIIRNDSIKEFVTYINQANIPLTSQIQRSKFETNSLLLEKEANLIEYSAFFGSIQIFNYLRLNKVKITPFTCLCAIHSKNAELIQILEENKNIPEDLSYLDCLVESIKCHHNEIANYFQENYINDTKIDYFNEIIPSYNYIYFNENDLKRSEFIVKLIKYNYVTIVKFCLNDYKDDINSYLNNFKNEDIKLYLNELNNNDIQKYFRNDKKYSYQFNDDRHYEVECTLLTIAISNENIEIVKYLIINKNAQINIKYSKVSCHMAFLSKSMIYLAVEVGNKEIVEFLLNYDQSFEKDKSFWCDLDKSIDFFIKFYYREFDESEYEENCLPLVANENKTLLTKAVENEDKEIIELLLNSKKINVNEIVHSSISCRMSEDDFYTFHREKKTALSIAVEKANIEIIKILTKVNINVNMTVSNMDNDDFRDFCDSGKEFYDFDYRNHDESLYTELFSSLDIAQKNGNDEIYQLLLQKSKNYY